MFLDDILKNIEVTYQTLIVVILLSIFLLIASYFDFRYKKIPNKLNLAFFILRVLLIPLLGFKFDNALGLVLGAITILIPAMIMNKPMGGDIKAIAVLGLYLGSYGVFSLIAITTLIALIYLLFKVYVLKIRKDIPLAPFFLIAHIIMLLLVI